MIPRTARCGSARVGVARQAELVHVERATHTLTHLAPYHITALRPAAAPLASLAQGLIRTIARLFAFRDGKV